MGGHLAVLAAVVRIIGGQFDDLSPFEASPCLGYSRMIGGHPAHFDRPRMKGGAGSGAAHDRWTLRVPFCA
jgi:hypothetical protein